MPALPVYKGWDAGAVLKLVSALVLIGVMAGAMIEPQARVVLEAGDALCGTRRTAHALRHLDFDAEV